MAERNDEFVELQLLHLNALTSVGRKLASMMISAIDLLEDDMKSGRIQLSPESQDVWEILKNGAHKHYDIIAELLEERNNFLSES